MLKSVSFVEIYQNNGKINRNITICGGILFAFIF